MSRANGTIIIKKSKKGGHSHHGGAWKIAYADFVTAMMAFFLLMWLINMTTPEQKQGLANYFAPPNVSESLSGSGGAMAGRAMDTMGAMTSNSDAEGIADTDGEENSAIEAAAGNVRDTEAAEKDSSANLSSTDPQLFHSAAASIRQAWEAMPEITEISDNLIVEATEEGLDIQIIDQRGRPMFQEGSKYPYEWMRAAIAAIAPTLERLPNQVRISGHTAAGVVYSDPAYTAWELSTDRANTVRSILGEFGLSNERIHSVVGRASSEPYFVNDPYLAANERIRITVINEASPIPLNMAP
ncbi:flagellar motor protein MotB [Pelagibacterium sp. H642]|uniref:flagellar motor protein MotB n=1 Tax=Pelagibacterium sp. H642 TaxID=1881069 RepID=UPI00281656E8|nr:flagellar motor protein MotB [Pelagibacterium sp. H642]WMT90533.1 OmpA family protein [Pelagibacterium sp. H642]